MTNELAIRIITGDILGTNEQTHEAVTMAVKALSMPSAQTEQKYIDPCDTCQYNSLDWHEEPCESCTGEDNHWKPSASPTQTNTSKALEALDCISRAAAIEVADAIWCVTGDKNVAKVWDQLKDLPSAEPELKTGKWIYNSPVTMKCNQCGLVIKDWDWHRFKYCPNCCSDMRGGRE